MSQYVARKLLGSSGFDFLIAEVERSYRSACRCPSSGVGQTVLVTVKREATVLSASMFLYRTYACAERIKKVYGREWSIFEESVS